MKEQQNEGQNPNLVGSRLRPRQPFAALAAPPKGREQQPSVTEKTPRAATAAPATVRRPAGGVRKANRREAKNGQMVCKPGSVLYKEGRSFILASACALGSCNQPG